MITIILGLYLSSQITCGYFDENGVWKTDKEEDIENEKKRKYNSRRYSDIFQTIEGKIKSVEVKCTDDGPFEDVTFDVLDFNGGILDNPQFEFHQVGIRRMRMVGEEDRPVKALNTDRLTSNLPNSIRVNYDSETSGENFDYIISDGIELSVEIDLLGSDIRSTFKYLLALSRAPFYLKVEDWPVKVMVTDEDTGERREEIIHRRAVFRIYLQEVNVTHSRVREIEPPQQSVRKLKLSNFFRDLKTSLSNEINQKMDQLSTFMEKSSKNQNSNFMKNETKQVIL
jgi:hypothetical protein